MSDLIAVEIKFPGQDSEPVISHPETSTTILMPPESHPNTREMDDSLTPWVVGAVGLLAVGLTYLSSRVTRR